MEIFGNGKNTCKVFFLYSEHQALPKIHIHLIRNNRRRPIPLRLLRRIDQKPRNALPCDRRRKLHSLRAHVPTVLNRERLPLLQHDRPDKDIVQTGLLHFAVHVGVVFPLVRHVRGLDDAAEQEVHVGPGVGDAEGGHGYDLADGVGFHGADGVRVRVGHHPGRGGVGGPGVVRYADGVYGDDNGGGGVLWGGGYGFFDVDGFEGGAFLPRVGGLVWKILVWWISEGRLFFLCFSSALGLVFSFLLIVLLTLDNGKVGSRL